MKRDSNHPLLYEASRQRRGLARELFTFLRESKRWWLTPIILCILGLGLLVFLGGTAAAPFLYTLF